MPELATPTTLLPAAAGAPALPAAADVGWWSRVQAAIAADLRGMASAPFSGTPVAPAWSVKGEPTALGFGYSVADAGDVNGDGYADIAVSAVNEGLTATPNGKVYIFHGSATGITGAAAAPAWSAADESGSSRFGSSVAGAGDVNGDGYGDIVVGALGYSLDDTQQNALGKVYVFHGSPGGITGTAAAPIWSAAGENRMALLGQTVAGAGDVNGDGYADIVVGSPGYGNNGSSNAGKVYVFHGGSGGVTGTVAAPAWSAAGQNSGDDLGWRVGGIGDVNGDGYADIGASGYRADSYSGHVYVFHGGSNGVAGATATPGWRVTGANQYDELGYALAAAGDVNGDGFADVIVGEPSVDTPNGGVTGIVYVFQGGGGRPVLAQQVRGDNSAPVMAWGLSCAMNGLNTRMVATSPQGRQRVKLQVEACPAGAAFAADACRTQTSAAWEEISPVPGVTLALTVTGLADNSLYHWRARLLYAPSSITQANITAPANPAHGPWRRLDGGTGVANVRIGFPPKTLGVSAVGNGKVTSAPAGIDCAGTCSAAFRHGTVVTLAATPATGHSLSTWSGACSGTDPCRVTMDAAKSVTATFTLNSYVLNVSKVGDGKVTSTPAGIDCGGTCAAAFNYGTVITLAATPAAGYSGTAAFTYTVADGSGLTSSALVAVVVHEAANSSGTPQALVLPDPAAAATLTVSTPAGNTIIVLPAGALAAANGTDAAYALVYNEVISPALALPGVQFAGRAFTLDLFVDAVQQDGYVFAQPILLTLSYDPAVVPDPAQIALYAYDKQSDLWSSEGITVVAVDPVQHTFTVSVAHLTRFAAGVRLAAPATLWLYLPVVSKQ